jgi:prepilin-type N-terminal cleavage/methylation domain-containing protein
MKKINHPIAFGSCEKGLTMIEVLISMAIFAIGFLAIAGLVAATAKNNTTGNTLTQATMLARAQVEYLKILPLSQLAVDCPEGMEPETVDRIYSRTCKTIPLGGTGTINTIEVTVQWQKSGQLRQVVLQTNTRGRGQ